MDDGPIIWNLPGWFAVILGRRGSREPLASQARESGLG
jgi:hypothetical protein